MSMIRVRLTAVVILACLLASSLFADEVHERRATAGLRLFRALLAADMNLPAKIIAPNEVLVVFLYVKDRRRAETLARRFVDEAKDGNKLRGLTVVTEVSNDPSLESHAARSPAGVFIAEAPSRGALGTLIQAGIQRHVIVYSPFEGHVESGVLGGVSVEAQVRPFLNRATLQASQITLKPFFLDVAKVFQ
jgi:hypothetical protein